MIWERPTVLVFICLWKGELVRKVLFQQNCFFWGFFFWTGGKAEVVKWCLQKGRHLPFFEKKFASKRCVKKKAKNVEKTHSKVSRSKVAASHFKAWKVNLMHYTLKQRERHQASKRDEASHLRTSHFWGMERHHTSGHDVCNQGNYTLQHEQASHLKAI